MNIFFEILIRIASYGPQIDQSHSENRLSHIRRWFILVHYCAYTVSQTTVNTCFSSSLSSFTFFTRLPITYVCRRKQTKQGCHWEDCNTISRFVDSVTVMTFQKTYLQSLSSWETFLGKTRNKTIGIVSWQGSPEETARLMKPGLPSHKEISPKK